jgi:DtxR family Mn-dependent transcriptional regulator
MAAEHATVAEEEYLESLFWLFEAGLPMTGANLARAMQLSAPTVHEMLGRLERDGYIARGSGRRAIEFTTAGRGHAERIVSRHRMIERFLTDVVGVPWDDVHAEAEQLEHAMTPRFEAYVRAAVGDATTCPHGHPIRVGERIDGVPLADCQVGARVTILRLENEAEDLLHYLKQTGIAPGMRGTVAANDGEQVEVQTGDRLAAVTHSVAETVSVLADPSPPPRIALPEQLVLGRERYGR